MTHITLYNRRGNTGVHVIDIYLFSRLLQPQLESDINRIILTFTFTFTCVMMGG